MKNELETQNSFLRHFFSSPSLSRSYNQASIAFIDFRTVFSFCSACLFLEEKAKKRNVEWQSFSCHSFGEKHSFVSTTLMPLLLPKRMSLCYTSYPHVANDQERRETACVKLIEKSSSYYFFKFYLGLSQVKKRLPLLLLQQQFSKL